MRKFKYLLVPLFTFVAGAIFSWQIHKEYNDTTNILVQNISSNLTGYIDQLEETRSIDNLEITIDLVDYIVSLEEQQVAPRKFQGERFVNLLSVRISSLKSARASITKPESIKKIDFLLEKANVLINKIEFNYY